MQQLALKHVEVFPCAHNVQCHDFCSFEYDCYHPNMPQYAESKASTDTFVDWLSVTW